MNMQKMIKSLGSAYNKSSLWCKLLILMSLLLLIMLVFRGFKQNKFVEGFEQKDQFLVKSGSGIYDDFYADIYDYLVFNNLKDDYEVGYIMNSASPSSESKILDVGCGTGHHVASLGSKGLDVIGIDISTSMIKKAKENFPDYKFNVGDALDGNTFEPNSFTHILCMYFTIYYFKDKTQFFNNCFRWLMPGGYLIVHLVDRHNFDPILPPGNPLLYVSPQRYAKERITSTKVKFTDFSYSADFKLDDKNDKALFVEKFKNDSDGKVRKNEHTLYMPDLQQIVDEAQACGFIVESKADLLQCQYEYQYLYVFVKPM
jgi:ubiquinone/menaquinone biosynthesis C-methylase UbiE